MSWQATKNTHTTQKKVQRVGLPPRRRQLSIMAFPIFVNILRMLTYELMLTRKSRLSRHPPRQTRELIYYFLPDVRLAAVTYSTFIFSWGILLFKGYGSLSCDHALQHQHQYQHQHRQEQTTTTTITISTTSTTNNNNNRTTSGTRTK